MIDFAFRTGKNYYPEVFLKCKYIMKKKMPKYITDNLDIFLKILMKRIIVKKNSDEEIILKNKVLFEGVIARMSFLMDEFI